MCPSIILLCFVHPITAINTTDLFEDTADFTTLLPDDVFDLITTELSKHVQLLYSIGCNRSVSGYINSDNTVYIDFNTTETMDVVITNCPTYSWLLVPYCAGRNGPKCQKERLERIWDWNMDTIMYLKNSNGVDVTNQSYNLCDGDNCWVSEVCTRDRAETIVMKNLRPDQYRLELSALDNSSDPFRVNVSCGDFSNLTSLWDPYHCLDPNASLSDPTIAFIGCNDSISGHITCEETKTFVFWLEQEDNVVFDNCGSTFDTKLYLYDSTNEYLKRHSNTIQKQSINACDGDDCHWTTANNRYCDGHEYPQSETIPMMNLPAGLYYLDLLAYSGTLHGEYRFRVHCGVQMPEPCNGTLDHCNYVQLGTLKGRLKKLPYPFNESIHDDAIYPIGYCYDNHVDDELLYSFQFGCGATGGAYLQTYEKSSSCKFKVFSDGIVKQTEYLNISGMIYCNCLLLSVHMILI